MHSFVMKSYNYIILNAVYNRGSVRALLDCQWCRELCFADAAVSKDSRQLQIPMQGRRRSVWT
jgi:hypothetical protein